MRVLLISPNKETLPDPVSPLGLAYIAGSLSQSGHEVQLLDLAFQQDEGLIRERIVAYKPDFIGVTIRNIDNVAFPATTSYLPEIKLLIEQCQAATDSPIVVGGAGFTLMPEPILQFLNLDYGIVGDGEEAICQFADYLAGKRSITAVANLVYRRADNSFGVNELRFDLDPTTVPAPRRDLLDNAAYYQIGGSGNFQTKRGCSFRCIYCSYPLIQGRGLRLKSPTAVAKELAETSQAYGINHFYLVDSVFNNPPNHAYDVCQAIAAHTGDSVKWTCYASPWKLSATLVAAMVKAGCSGVELGTDTAHEGMLSLLGKPFGVADVIAADQRCRREGLACCHSLLLGGPGETLDTARTTLDLMAQLDPDAVIIMNGIRIFPRTKLAEIARAEGVISTTDSLLNARFYLATGAQEWLLDLVSQYVSRYKRWIVPGTRHLMSDEIHQRIRKYGHRGPLWEYLARVRRFQRKPGDDSRSAAR